MEPIMGKFDVEKFGGEGDFSLWKFKMLAQLEILGLDAPLLPVYIEEEEILDPKDKDTKDSKDPKEQDPKETVEDKFAKAKADPKFSAKDKRAKNLIGSSLSDAIMRSVKRERTAYDMWMALEAEYQVKTLPHRFNLKQRFYAFKMDARKNLDKNLDMFSKLISDLASGHIEMSDEDKAAILINNLQKQFDNLVHKMKYSSGRETITVKDIVSSAYSIEIELKEKGLYKLKTKNKGLVVQERGKELK